MEAIIEGKQYRFLALYSIALSANNEHFKKKKDPSKSGGLCLY